MPLRHSSVDAVKVSTAVLLAEALVMKVLGTKVRLCLLCGCTETFAVAVSAEVLVTRVMSMTKTLVTEVWLCLLCGCTSVRDCTVAHSSAVVRAEKRICAVAGRCIVWSCNVWTNVFFR
jgi:hypothetical protein